MIHVERWLGIGQIKCHDTWTTGLNRDKIIRWWLLTALYWLVDLVMGPLYSDWYYRLCTRLITATATFTVFSKVIYSGFNDGCKLHQTTKSYKFFSIMIIGFNLKRASFWVDRLKRQIRNCIIIGCAVICDGKNSF